MAKRSNNESNNNRSTPLPEAPPDFDPDVPSREAILKALRSAGAPLSPVELAERMGVERPATMVGFERRLGAMERDGQLMPNRKGVLLLATKLDFVAGKVLGHRDGFGFLLRDDGGPDLFLSPREMLKVLHGDRVLVKPSGEYRGKPEGTIVEVIERRTNKLVGRFLHEHGLSIVVPEDQRIKHDILIPPSDTNGAQHGQVVSVEIMEQPTRHTQPLGRVAEVLGEIDDPGMEIEIAVRKFDVPVEFSEAARKQAARLPDVVRKGDLKDRVDLRDVPLITIDGEDARDFDDAVYCEAVELGTGQRKRPGWRLLVAIADVSHYVRPGDALDDDALERGTSVYFPRRVIPMLPESLSNGLCSLNPDVDRLVLVCDMVIPASGAKAGTVTAYQFYNAVMHSHARTTYTNIWAALQQPGGPAAHAMRAVMPQVQSLYELFHLLSQSRKKRGAIDFDTVETKIVCNELGRIEQIVPSVRNDAHKLIEECMLAANTCAADFMTRSKHPGLYRIHEGPTPERLQSLREFLRTMGLSLGGGDTPTAKDYGDFLDSVRGRPDYQLLQTMCLRSMQQAIYSPDNLGHFGLSYPGYSHFTSPIRRYPDLLTHRVIKALLAGQRYVPSLDDQPVVIGRTQREHEHAIWEKLGLVLSASERRADEASRDVEAWLKCWFVKERVGEDFSGTVTGVASFGIFVTLDTLHVEGLVHVSELGGEYFQFNDALHELRGERTGMRYRLTDKVQVQVSRVDLEARRIEFRLVQGTSFDALRKAAARGPDEGPRRVKKAAAPKPAALKGQTAKERRAEAKKAGKPSNTPQRAAPAKKATRKRH
ncbi:ribonuclease R [Achromobacter xylosoxidans]|uniref:Ribonuclease R n=2 Tax=Achromobacter TaxID=222 RepID=A0A2M9GRZ5_9BURK|nr:MULTISPECIES: ribonuclease R [Achromobacter]AKP89253.1 3'-to-5' exoribonuclease RNase R [Achromobacter xylosoxidans]ALX83254.1 ribonuclease R [Achromobacter denitrificans]AVC42753.1 ribonuclease R [Achromobacter xylosoxidans]MCI1838487.1 ribonuclease R [Achromobacter ruhlandii]MCV6799092.1 ribonuclease R [Achromobacter ruhlandii]